MISPSKTPQQVSLDDAVRLARDIYGLQVKVRSFPGEYDNNFHVTTREGRAFVLKLMHAGRERSFLDLQCLALQHLEDHAPEIPLPRVQLTSQGEAFTNVALADGQERFVWLLSFLPGKTLAEVRPHTPE